MEMRKVAKAQKMVLELLMNYIFQREPDVSDEHIASIFKIEE
jgi:hypothetical protein